MFTIKSHDFTSHRFLQLCEAISDTYSTVTMTEYLENRHPDQFIIMRHDVDRIPDRALVTARIEHDLGIKSTYYFRTIKSVFKPSIIRQINDMGHEVGYHYETLSEAKGDYQKAMELFQLHLDSLREICEVKTICMHGRPLSKFDNRDIWNKYDFRDYGLIGEAYLSVGNNLNYFSDTGRTWGAGNNLRDYLPGNNKQLFADKTNDLIKLIENKRLNNYYILTHPERWPSSTMGWGMYYSVDLSVNLGKKILTTVRKSNSTKKYTDSLRSGNLQNEKLN